jgi:hypoxanthine phosphoribosyltransferase
MGEKYYKLLPGIKMILLEESQLEIKNNKTYMSWADFDRIADKFAAEIRKLNPSNKACLLGIARGGLPILTVMSHKTGIRNLSVLHLQITNSEASYDYGNIRLVLDALRHDCDEYIILEDIIETGQTLSFIIKHLTEQNKKIRAVFSLVIREGFKDAGIVPIFGGCMGKPKSWLCFPWEQD